MDRPLALTPYVFFGMRQRLPGVLRISSPAGVFVLHPLSQLDPESFISLGTRLILGWWIFRARLFELLTVARAAIMDHMSDGVNWLTQFDVCGRKCQSYSCRVSPMIRRSNRA